MKQIFSLAEFSQKAEFKGARFSKSTFVGTKFSNEAAFRDSKFSKEADFIKAKFFEADFNEAYFMEAIFTLSTFSNIANFGLAVFSGPTVFSYAKFSDEVRFLQKQESKVFNHVTYFNYTIFEQPHKALFDTTDLSMVSFHGSDISKVTFTDRVKWGGKDGMKIIEEGWLENGQQISLELVLYVYRRLRENYEFKLKFDEAGKFFIKEMELKRTYRTVRLRDKSDSEKL